MYLKNQIKVAILQIPDSPLNLIVHGGLERIELCQLYGLNKRGIASNLFVSKLVGGQNSHIHQILDLNPKNRVLKYFYFINFCLKNIGVSILHGFYTPILSLLAPAKSITHFQGNSVTELPLYRFFKKRYNASYYVFLSEYTKKEFEQIYPALNKKNIVKIYNCVDVDHFKPQPNTPKADSSRTCICFYGGWIPEKGIFDILAAAELLEKKRKDFMIYLGGSANSHYKNHGDTKSLDLKVRERVSRLNTVTIVGDLGYNELPGFINSMDFGLMPSTYPEPFGIVNIEIMACEKPVIATRVGGIPEIIDDSVNGFLIEPNKPNAMAEKIELLIDNKELCRKMGIEARIKVLSHFSLDKYLDELIKLYTRILDKK